LRERESDGIEVAIATGTEIENETDVSRVTATEIETCVAVICFVKSSESGFGLMIDCASDDEHEDVRTRPG
jgi:hypothetical protein